MTTAIIPTRTSLLAVFAFGTSCLGFTLATTALALSRTARLVEALSLTDSTGEFITSARIVGVNAAIAIVVAFALALGARAAVKENQGQLAGKGWIDASTLLCIAGGLMTAKAF